ncbi:hypothetical protein AJ80_04094 [Polytolypa hystricis UAMH7299]|uniref:F-box domain-containing protein n=1 Tax=Polytolypa hystricis (strain UAMH7299) TaxID=1447883 RepID=A0A2B7YDS1_POLH7|nr:hypothetical protein AJ80_04094 [Polytolypa hystricis UAMH7299]
MKQATTSHSSLMTLPAELLYPILRYVGANEFRQRTDRLIVCKRWYSIAVSVFMEDVKLSDANLKIFRQPLDVAAADNNNTTCVTLTRIKRVSVYLEGFRDWRGHEDPITPRAMKKRYVMLSQWSAEMLADLSLFAAWLGTLNTLESFRFQALGESDPGSRIQSHVFGPRDYLHRGSMTAVLGNLPVHRLRVLDIDTCDAEIFGRGTTIGAVPAAARKNDDMHLCKLIAKHVATLTSLRVRMRSICPDIFGLEDLQFTTDCKTFVFHLTVCHRVRSVDAAKSTVMCLDVSSSREELINSLIKGANAAAQKMPNLRVLVLHHVFPSSLLRTDCRTGETTGLGDDGVNWLDSDDCFAGTLNCCSIKVV